MIGMAAKISARLFRDYMHRPRYHCRRNFSQAKCPQQKKVPSKECAKKSGLENKVAIVTGGAEGIGYAIAKIFLKKGAKGVTIADCNKDKAVESLKTLTCEFGEDKVIYVETDVSKSKQYDWIFKKTIQNFEAVDIVVNNAGIMNDTSWENQLTTNLQSVVIGTLLSMQYMSKTCLGKGGVIINVSSVMGLIPSSGYPIHTMTQFGIVGFSRGMGNECHFERTGVKVVTLCPGLTNTKLLRQCSYYSINEKFQKMFKEETSGCVCQKPENVALAVAEILDKCDPGSVWVAESDGKPYEIQFPPVSDMSLKPNKKC